MVYKVTQADMRVLLGSNIFDSIPTTVRPNDSIPMMNFRDLGNEKERLLLLIIDVIVNSTPHKFERRQTKGRPDNH